jgi:hypothetical protein
MSGMTLVGMTVAVLALIAMSGLLSYRLYRLTVRVESLERSRDAMIEAADKGLKAIEQLGVTDEAIARAILGGEPKP